MPDGFQSSKGGLSALSWKKARAALEQEQSCYHNASSILMQDGLKHDGRFKQPRYRAPKFGQCIAQWMSRCVRHCIGAIFYQTAPLFAGETFGAVSWADLPSAF